MTWILDNGSTIVVASLLFIFVFWCLKKVYRDKKQGNCTGGCSDCGASSLCHSKESLVQEYYKNKA